MRRVSIETTQNVQIDYDPASIGDRILAYLIDVLIIVAYGIAMYILVTSMAEFLREIDLLLPIVIILYLPIFLYHFLSEVFLNGQSVGKRQRKIKVMCLDGTQPSIGNYLIRWILRPVDISIFQGAVAIITISANGRGQRLADMAAGTMVVKVKPKIELEDLRRLFQTTEDDGYTPAYDQVLMLSDNDINIIKDIIAKRHKIRDHQIFDSLVNKIKETLNITYEGAPLPFLQTILKDYNYLANQEN